MRGSLSGHVAVEVAGSFEGPIDIEGLCQIGEGARVTGPVTTSDARKVNVPNTPRAPGW